MGMRNNLDQMPDFEGSIAADGRPYVWLEPGPTYDCFVLETDLAAAEIEALVIEKNNEERVRISGVQMQDREAYDGFGATSGYFVFSFADDVSKLFAGEAMTGLVTNPGDRVKLTLELSSGVIGTETAVLYAGLSPNRPVEEFALFCVPESIQITKSGGSGNTFTGFRRGTVPWNTGVGGIAIRRAFNYGSITKLQVGQDDGFPWGKAKLSKALIDATLKRLGKTVPTSSTCVVFDAIARGNTIADLFDTFSRKSLKVNYTTSDTNDLTALTEYVERVAVVNRAAA